MEKPPVDIEWYDDGFTMEEQAALRREFFKKNRNNGPKITVTKDYHLRTMEKIIAELRDKIIDKDNQIAALQNQLFDNSIIKQLEQQLKDEDQRYKTLEQEYKILSQDYQNLWTLYKKSPQRLDNYIENKKNESEKLTERLNQLNKDVKQLKEMKNKLIYEVCQLREANEEQKDG